MLSFVSRTRLCVDVFQDGKYIGELFREDGGKWETGITIKSGINFPNYKKIADKLDELNAKVKG